MAIHDLTPPNGGGERYRLLNPQIGPVTRVIAVMRAADPDRQQVRELRASIASRIAADLALLDAIDGRRA